MDETMGVAICRGPRQMALETRPIPPIDPEKVLVKVGLCGICGSDLAVWQGKDRKYPYSPGHEFSGTVTKVGSWVTAVIPGQRVVINPNLECGSCSYCVRGLPNLCDFLKSRPTKSNGGFSEYVALDCRMVYPLATTISEEEATFVEPLSCALHAVRVAEIEDGDTVLVLGGGILGLLTGVVLESLERQFAFTEPSEQRRVQLKKLFDVPCLTPQELGDVDKGKPYSVAIDCSGNVNAISQAIELVEKGGRLVMLGVVETTEASVPLGDVTKKELKLRGSWLNPGTFPDALRLAERYGPLLKKLKTKTFNLNDIQRAFECAEQRRYSKVFVRP